MGGGALWARVVVVDHQVARKGDDLEALTPHTRRSRHMAERVTAIDVIGGRRITYLLQIVIAHDYRVQSSYKGAPDKPCGVGRADANPKTMLPNDT